MADEEQLQLPIDGPGEQTTEDAAPPWPEELKLADAGRERRLLTRIARAAREAAARESKIAALVRLLRRAGESALVFTEYRDTLCRLQAAMVGPVVMLHGGMTRDERRRAVHAFSSSPKTVMLATDAAAEGLNLHIACRLVVNLELPWNPMRLEQRIGRVDRIGQRRIVHAIHLVAAGTGEATLLARLKARVERARSAIGAPNPLGAADERDAAALVVLGREEPDAAPASSDAAATTRVDLRQPAREECARLLQIRRVPADQGPRDRRWVDPPGPLILRARPRLRQRLGGRRLEIWRVAAEDTSGRRVESKLIGTFVDRGRDLTADAVAASSADWRLAASEIAGTFASTRLARDTAIAALHNAATSFPFQAGLFDRRREREWLASVADRTAYIAAVERRLVDIGASAALTFSAAELLLVAIP